MIGKPTRILVTGAAGFIGSHLSQQLLQDGLEVVGFDNFCDYYNPAVKEKNIKFLQEYESFHLVRGDIRNIEVVKKVFDRWQFETVIHLAAMVGIRNSVKHPASYIEVNMEGTAKLLELSVRTGIKNFILASSSSVYGTRRSTPFKEDDSTDMPCSPYAATKKASEIMAYAYHNLYDIPISCLRFFTVYGPRGRPDMAIFKFIEKISNDIPIQQYGDGTSSRDYTYIDDVIKGIISAMKKPHDFEVYNLGRSEGVMLKDLIKIIEDVVGKKANIEYLPNQPGDVPITLADISKARKMLNYNPSISLKEGIAKTVAWFKDFNF